MKFLCKRWQRPGLGKWILAALLTAAAGNGWAQWFCPESAGARVGFSFSDTAHNFHQAEAFGNWNLPWNWNLGSRWHAQGQAAFSVGWLADHGEDAFITTLGPALVLRREHLPLSLAGGSSPTLLSRADFMDKDFGTVFQFTSYIGLNWDLNSRFRIGYRFQHMSNAGLSGSNPGLNLHVIAASFRF